jgi:hypothetical protein
VILSVIASFLKLYPPFQVANYPVLPGLSSLKIKSDETNLFSIKIRKKRETGPEFFAKLIQNLTLRLIILRSEVFEGRTAGKQQAIITLL